MDTERNAVWVIKTRDFHRLETTLTEDGEIDEDADPPYNVVIVDEVSMVDAPLMAELLKRIDFTKTRLVLVGDHNQLPPVGPGNVLRDIIDHDLVPTVILDEVVRQAGILKTNSTAVLAKSPLEVPA